MESKEPKAEPEQATPEPDLLRGHTIALITTDEKGCINMTLDIPAQARVDFQGNTVYFQYLLGRLMKFLGTMQETINLVLLEKQLTALDEAESKQLRAEIMRGRDN